MIIPSYDPRMVLDHMRINLTRDLPEVRPCRAHSHVMSVAGGGPSLEDTWNKIDGYVCTVNGSLKYLAEQGKNVHACGVLDPNEYIAKKVHPRPDVHYYVASMVHPKVFEKLKDCNVTIWHASGPPGVEDFLRAEKPDDWYMVGGGSTMGIRWITLGYVLGFRRFHLHGLDSSYREGRTHAYKDRPREQRMMVGDRETSPNYLQQVTDYGHTLERLSQQDLDPTELTLYGEGLLQDQYA